VLSATLEDAESSHNRGNLDDEQLLAEMRVLRPRVEKLLDAIEQRAEKDGEAKLRQAAYRDVKYLLRMCAG